MGGLLTLPSFVATFPEIDTLKDPNNDHVTTIQGITVASYNLGCFIGAIVTMFIGDILGRRRLILLGSTIVVIGVSMISILRRDSSYRFCNLYLGRINITSIAIVKLYIGYSTSERIFSTTSNCWSKLHDPR